MKICEIFDYINEFAPFETQVSYDNAGLLIGSKDDEFAKIGVCLDVTKSAVKSAVESGVDLIISHHPVIWGGVKSIESKSVIYSLIENKIDVISAHTNLDIAKNGVCETLCETLGVHSLQPAFGDEFPDTPLGRIGIIDGEMMPDKFAEYLKNKLNAPDIRYIGEKKVKKIGIFNGAGSDLIPYAIRCGADSVLTSDIKHHEWLNAAANNINLFDAGHFCTENVIIQPLKDMINQKFGEIAVILPQSAPYKAI